MKIYKFGDRSNIKKTTMLLGSFESFHIGHLKLYEKAKEFKNPIGILIFDQYVNFKRKNSPEYQSLLMRLKNLANIGFDFVVVATFNDEFKKMTGEEFINKLTTIYHVEELVCGKDLLIGNNRSWNVANIKNYFDSTTIIPILKFHDSKISTSKIIENIILGDLKINNELLVNKWEIGVHKGDGMMIVKKNQLLPHCGVYYGEAVFKNIAYPVLLRVSFDGKLFYRSLSVLPIEHYEVGSVVFFDKKRIIIKEREDIILDQELKQLKVFFSERVDDE